MGYHKLKPPPKVEDKDGDQQHTLRIDRELYLQGAQKAVYGRVDFNAIASMRMICSTESYVSAEIYISVGGMHFGRTGCLCLN